MVFTTSLLKLLNRASYSTVDGYEIDEWDARRELENESVIQVSRADEVRLCFKEQDVTVDESGKAHATDISGEEHTFEFSVSGPVKESDLKG